MGRNAPYTTNNQSTPRKGHHKTNQTKQRRNLKQGLKNNKNQFYDDCKN